MSVTKRNVKVLRVIVAALLSVIMATGVFGAMSRSHATTNEEYCYYYLTKTMGLNTAAASGIMANLDRESSFNPTISGDSGSSFGICQWHADRKTQLIEYCNSNGLDYHTLSGQLSFMNYELRNKFPDLLNTLKSTTNTGNGAYNAGYQFCYDFEKPAALTSQSQQRGSLASGTYFPKYSGTSSASTATTTRSVSYTTGNYVVSTGGSNLNVRSGPSANYEAVAKITDGTPVYVSQVSNGWGKITVSGVTGWVAMEYLTKA